jgi:hypothetical protein
MIAFGYREPTVLEPISSLVLARSFGRFFFQFARVFGRLPQQEFDRRGPGRCAARIFSSQPCITPRFHDEARSSWIQARACQYNDPVLITGCAFDSLTSATIRLLTIAALRSSSRLTTPSA